MRDLFACAASRSLYMDAEGPRDGARSADVRFAELCCADVARCTRWRCRRQPAHCTPPSSSVTPRCFEITVLKTSARWPARALLMKAPRSRSGLVVTGGTGLQFLNWSCRRQPFHRLAASPLGLHPKGGPRSIPIPTLYYGNPSARVFLRGATPLATVCHGALLSAREGPWCVTSSPARLHGLCIWMPKALATELGPRTFVSRSCAVLTWRAVPAGAAEGSPRTVHRLARL